MNSRFILLTLLTATLPPLSFASQVLKHNENSYLVSALTPQRLQQAIKSLERAIESNNVDAALMFILHGLPIDTQTGNGKTVLNMNSNGRTILDAAIDRGEYKFIDDFVNLLRGTEGIENCKLPQSPITKETISQASITRIKQVFVCLNSVHSNSSQLESKMPEGLQKQTEAEKIAAAIERLKKAIENDDARTAMYAVIDFDIPLETQRANGKTIFNIGSNNSSKLTVLMLAAKEGYLKFIEKLAKYAIKENFWNRFLNAIDKDGNSALTHAIITRKYRMPLVYINVEEACLKQVETIKLLLNLGAFLSPASEQRVRLISPQQDIVALHQLQLLQLNQYKNPRLLELRNNLIEQLKQEHLLDEILVEQLQDAVKYNLVDRALALILYGAPIDTKAGDQKTILDVVSDDGEQMILTAAISCGGHEVVKQIKILTSSITEH